MVNGLISFFPRKQTQRVRVQMKSMYLSINDIFFPKKFEVSFRLIYSIQNFKPELLKMAHDDWLKPLKRLLGNVAHIISAAPGLYEGPSTLMVVTVAMKQRWNSRSGSGGWLSQSSLPLRKCLRKPCGPDGALAWLGPSCGLGPDPEKHTTDNIKHFSEPAGMYEQNQ